MKNRRNKMKDKDVLGDFEFWKEYPKRDTEFPRWYPPAITPIDPTVIWRKKKIGLYLHIPFCKVICKYCPFNKYIWDSKKASDYVEALKKEIRFYDKIPYLQDCKIIAMYLGGGTPTCLTSKQLVEVISCCRESFDIRDDAEINIEVNPETAHAPKLEALFNAGVNRVSFGVQTFNERFLKMIGRPHKVRQAIFAVELAKQIGFDIINIDLLYRLPSQTLADWEKDLNQALDLNLNNLSIYELCTEPGTKLYEEIRSSKIPPQPDDETFTKMHDMAIKLLTEAGYRQYNQCYDFALPGRECLYNRMSLGSASQKEYIGLGAGAFSYINGYLYCNIHATKEYIQKINRDKLPVAAGKKVSKEEEMSRYMVLGMIGITLKKSKFKEQFGIDVEDVFGDVLKKLEAMHLVTIDSDTISLTHKGKIYSNNVSKSFYTINSRRKPQPVAVLVKEKYG